ncbi:MAG: hypothetical protein CMM02_19805 [Rhodopirellula sp.]|jgi:hypothetical protein|nr:hypothetical protein [Rhodopirellula sp.]|tara:strand:- start:125 stop:406 length:282 start_codon:yes stop_codon:yes gene_type:complete
MTQLYLIAPQKSEREYKCYARSDWLMVTPRSKSINYGIMLCNHYWYNPKHKIVLTTPMEDMFYAMIGKDGDSFALKCKNKELKPNPFTIIRRT